MCNTFLLVVCSTEYFFISNNEMERIIVCVCLCMYVRCTWPIVELHSDLDQLKWTLSDLGYAETKESVRFGSWVHYYDLTINESSVRVRYLMNEWFVRVCVGVPWICTIITWSSIGTESWVVISLQKTAGDGSQPLGSSSVHCACYCWLSDYDIKS